MSEKTSEMDILLTNNGTKELTLVSSEIHGSSSQSNLDLPQTIAAGSTAGGYGAKASDTPYVCKWSYTPDGGNTLLNFDSSLAGATGITITPSKSGPEADNWNLGESPNHESAWVVTFTYG